MRFGGPIIMEPLEKTCTEIGEATVAELEFDLPSWTGAICITARGVRVELQQRCMPLVQSRPCFTEYPAAGFPYSAALPPTTEL